MGRDWDPQGFETEVIHSLVDFEGASVIEIGAGDGRMTRRFASKASSVLALDPSDRDVEAAQAATPKELASKVDFRVADATDFPYPSSRFDIAVLSWSL